MKKDSKKKAKEEKEKEKEKTKEKPIVPFSVTEAEIVAPTPTSLLANSSDICRVKLSAESEQKILSLLEKSGFFFLQD